MSDSELDDLLSEMEFSSPSRSVYKEEKEVGPTGRAKGASDASSEKKVLISGSSLIGSGNLMDVYGEENIGEYPSSYLKPISEQDKKSKPVLGTSSKISKNYKVFVVHEPSMICGRVLNQGVTFCMNKRCAINHRSVDTANLVEGELYVVKTTEKGRFQASLFRCFENAINRSGSATYCKDYNMF